MTLCPGLGVRSRFFFNMVKVDGLRPILEVFVCLLDRKLVIKDDHFWNSSHFCEMLDGNDGMHGGMHATCEFQMDSSDRSACQNEYV